MTRPTLWHLQDRFDDEARAARLADLRRAMLDGRPRAEASLPAMAALLALLFAELALFAALVGG